MQIVCENLVNFCIIEYDSIHAFRLIYPELDILFD
jgi:hypothetical protein